MEIDYKRLGERIRRARKKKRMTQEELGEKTELSTAHIGHIERGTRIPSLEALLSLAAVLGTGLDALLCDSEPPSLALLSLADKIEQMEPARAEALKTVLLAMTENP